MHTLFRFPMMLAACTALPAQDLRFEAGGSLLSGFNATKKVTNQAAGIALEGAAHVRPLSTEVPLRLGLAYYWMPGKTFTTAKTSLQNLQASCDALMSTGTPKVRWFLGLSANRFRARNSGYEVMETVYTFSGSPRVNPVDAWAVTAGKDDKGLKLGLRLGLTVQLSGRLTGELLFQQTELSGGRHTDAFQVDATGKQIKDANGKPIPDYPKGYANKGGVNPAWLQFGLKYRF